MPPKRKRDLNLNLDPGNTKRQKVHGINGDSLSANKRGADDKINGHDAPRKKLKTIDDKRVANLKAIWHSSGIARSYGWWPEEKPKNFLSTLPAKLFPVIAHNLDIASLSSLTRTCKLLHCSLAATLHQSDKRTFIGPLATKLSLNIARSLDTTSLLSLTRTCSSLHGLCVPDLRLRDRRLLGNLVEEVLTEIVDILDSKSRKSLSRTCQKFRRIIKPYLDNESTLINKAQWKWDGEMQELLDARYNRCDPHATDITGKTALHYAVRLYNWEKEDDRQKKIRLLASYADIDVKMDKLGWTSLHYAAYHGYVDCLSLLCELGANPNETDIMGCTPLHIAYIYLRRGDKILLRKQIIDCLVLYGADKNATDTLGLKPSNYTFDKNRGIRHDVTDCDLRDFVDRDKWRYKSGF